MSFKKHAPGCPCCDGTGPTSAVCVRVVGCCSRRVTGASITLRTPDGVDVCTGESDDEGNLCCNDVPYGLYTLIVAATGYITVTTTVVVAASSELFVVVLSAAPGNHCSYCGTLPDAMTLNDGFGNITMGPTSPSSGVWKGCALRTALGGNLITPPGCAVGAALGVDVPVGFLASAGCDGAFSLNIYLPYANGGTFFLPGFFADATCADYLAHPTGSNVIGSCSYRWGLDHSLTCSGIGGFPGPCNTYSCSPFVAEETSTISGVSGLAQYIYGAGARTFTFSE